MAYPEDPLPVVVAFWDGSGWEDITDHVFVRDGGITIRRGFSDESNQPEPSSATLTLKNWDGRFSPRNRNSPYYGKIGRNTPVRVTVDLNDVDAADRVRYVGEVSEWPVRWNTPETDVWTPVVAQGVLRRLSQGRRPVQSPFRWGMLTPLFAGVVEAYWPMEDGPNATRFAPGLPGLAPLDYSGEPPDFGAIGGVFGSDKLPVLNATTSIRGTVPALIAGLPQTIRFWFVIDVPPTPSWSDNTPLVQVTQNPGTGSVDRWEVQYFTANDGSLAVAVASDSTAEVTSDLITGITTAGQLWVSVSITQGSGTAQVSMIAYSLDDGAVTVRSGSDSIGTGSNLVTTPTEFRIGVPPTWAPELVIGHFAFAAVPIGLAFSSTQIAHMLRAFAGERAADRAARLAADAGVTLTVVGTASETEAMGPQAVPSTFVEALAETWQADMALLYETRDQLGLTWRARTDLYNQPVALTLDYKGRGEVAPGLEPTDDDRYIRNDIEVRRKSGSSARVVDETSRAGVADPPAGAGRYEEQVEVNVAFDEQLLDQAYWRLHVGTWDEARYPRVAVNLAALAVAGKLDLVAAVCALDVGDRIQLTNLPAWTGAEGGVADLMVMGAEERIDHPTEWEMVLCCVPYGPWIVGVYGEDDADPADDPDRYDTAGCETLEGLWLPGTGSDYASTPDTSALDVTGDLDVRVDVIPQSWTPSSNQHLLAKDDPTGGQRAYRLRLNPAGTISLLWSPDGSSTMSVASTAPPSPGLSGRRGLRATLDVDNGSGGHTVTFYEAESIAGPWVQLGDPVTTAGTTSIFASSADLRVGVRGDGSEPFAGVVLAAEVRSGVNGTVVADPDFGGLDTGDTSFTDDAGRTWTVQGDAEVFRDFDTTVDTRMLVLTRVGPSWTTDPDDMPMRLRCADVVLEVTAVEGTGKPQVLTISSADRDAEIDPGEPISLARSAIYAL